MRLSTRAPPQARNNPPPFIAERWRRTTLSSRIDAPEPSSAALIAILSASVTGAAGAAISDDAPPLSANSEQIAGAGAAGNFKRGRGGALR